MTKLSKSGTAEAKPREPKYCIVRYFTEKGKAPQVMHRGLTRAQAKSMVESARQYGDPGDSWFEGYSEDMQ